MSGQIAVPVCLLWQLTDFEDSNFTQNACQTTKEALLGYGSNRYSVTIA